MYSSNLLFCSLPLCFTFYINGFWQTTLLSVGFRNCWMSHQNRLNHLWQIGNWSVNAISFFRFPVFTSFFLSHHDSHFPRLTSFFQFTSTAISFQWKHLYDRNPEKQIGENENFSFINPRSILHVLLNHQNVILYEWVKRCWRCVYSETQNTYM